jgi:hypothetical protein
MDNEIKKFKRFFVRKGTIILSSILAVLALTFYICLLVYERRIDEPSENFLIFSDVLKNVLIVIISVFLTSLLSVLLLERKNSNDISLNTIVQEVLATNECLDGLTQQNKIKIKHKLQNKLCEKQINILDDVRSMLFDEGSKYYFEECEYVIECTVYKEYIEKRVFRTLKVRSYAKQCKEKAFIFARMTNQEINGMPNLVLHSAKINGEEVFPEVIQGSKSNNVLEPVLRKHYDAVHKYVHRNTLWFKSEESTLIEVDYTTRVDVDDTNLCCRVSEHCNKLRVNFTISNPEEYNITGSAFGFVETGNDTIDNNRNSITFKFDKWVFKNGGFCINFKKK